MKKIGNILGIGIFLMVGLSFFSIVINALFNRVFIQLQELIIYLHSCVFMLGIVYTYHYDKHVRIDVFYQNKKKNKQNRINLLGTIFLLIPFFVFMFYTAFGYVTSSWSKLEGSAETGGLPFVYGLKTLLLILPVSMVFYVMIKLFRKS